MRFEVDSEDLLLLQTLTGIFNGKELEEHVLAVQNRANRIHNYPCIGLFVFTKFNIKLSPNYQQILSLIRTHQDAIFLDVGCCVGNALRKVVADGWPVENTIGNDLYKEFWDIGHELFKSTPESFPAGFIGGDIFDDAILAPPIAHPDDPNPDTVNLRDLTFLTPLRHRVSAIYVCNVFHLFNAGKQFELARRLASMLTRQPGSTIFGSHGVIPAQRSVTDVAPDSFHSAKSFANMWNEVFEVGSVEISWKTKVKPQRRLSVLGEWDIIWWSVTCI
ncbi:hypothetical protein J3R30DRAFT_3420182 [Lentinula aciculospora]|uniref:Methyltransferase domain-containing protein n=1 Tax=Lentinula aciculospora TaxID=153920 RepID=A0A9W9DX95_9AGAR|nr:hypothetical protein J3R30DRAFT_3420182 [Lentinula aciculospora]